MDAAVHLEALAAMRQSALDAIASEALEIRAQIDGDVEMLQQAGGTARPSLLDVPIEEPPPYIPPAPATAAHNALIPDTPLVDSPLSNSSLAFDDAPLWQN